MSAAGPLSTGPVASLDRQEHEVWQAFLDGSRVLFEALESQLQSDAGMPLAYYEILVALSGAPEQTLRMGALAKQLRSSTSRLSHAVNRLQSFGWIDRRCTPGDRRGQFAVLTDQGRDALRAAAPGHVAAVRRHLLDPLSDEHLVALLQISQAIRATATPQPERRAQPGAPARPQ